MYLFKQINNVRNQTGRILALVLADDNLENRMTVDSF